MFLSCRITKYAYIKIHCETSDKIMRIGSFVWVYFLTRATVDAEQAAVIMYHSRLEKPICF